jgi:putative tryptophan/tyrosine transport system substrate-binding protein
MPDLVCVGILAATPATDGGFGEILVEYLRTAATKAGLRLAPVLADDPNEFERSFETMSKAGAQAVIIQELFSPHRVALIDLATKHLLVLMGTPEITAAGGLVSMSPNYSVLYERAAFYVDKILKGATPGDLPVEQPTKFQSVLNMKTVQRLGLTASPMLLAQIDEIID